MMDGVRVVGGGPLASTVDDRGRGAPVTASRRRVDTISTAPAPNQPSIVNDRRPIVGCRPRPAPIQRQNKRCRQLHANVMPHYPRFKRPSRQLLPHNSTMQLISGLRRPINELDRLVDMKRTLLLMELFNFTNIYGVLATTRRVNS